jgi:protein arginine kinase
MTINNIITKRADWLKSSGPHSDIVISSRARLARNIEGVPFPHQADKKTRQRVLFQIKRSASEVPDFKGGMFLEMEKLHGLDRQILVERHLISYEHSIGSDGRGLYISENENIGLMINEEDHIRLQVMQSGLNLMEVYKIVDRIDTGLEKHLSFAFQYRWGYLASCPTNAGTGLRLSVMLHLPALVITKQIEKILSTIAKLSIMARGLYGEGTEPAGNFFQVSNQGSLGRTELEVLDSTEKIISQVIEYELNARETLFSKNKTAILDQIWRAYGILLYARAIPSLEALHFMSLARLGLDMGIIRDVGRDTLNDLFVMIQPAHLQKMEDEEIDEFTRDIRRADLIRMKIGGTKSRRIRPQDKGQKTG